MAFSSITKTLLQHSSSYCRSSLNFSRSYSRWSHRTPAKVLLPTNATSDSLKKEKIIDLGQDALKKASSSPEPVTVTKKGKVKNVAEELDKTNVIERETEPELKFNHVKINRNEKIKSTQAALKKSQVFDENNEIIYEKCKDNDGRISSLLVKLKSKKDRLRSGRILVEGFRMIVDGIEAKCNLQYVIFSQKEDLLKIRPFLPKSGVKVYKIPYKEIELWSDLETSPGILGIFEMPKAENIKRVSNPFPIQIVCDNIRVPGNLGSIMRAAAGAGCQRLLLTKGCVDMWDSKVVRSAAGAHFRLPVHSGVTWDNMTEFVHDDSSVFVADSNTNVNDDSEDSELADGATEEFSQIPLLPYYGVDYSKLKFVTLIIGGETEGISEESYRFAMNRNGVRLNIPLQRGVDSLNTGTAAAIIAFEIKKQLIQAYSKASREKNVVFGT